MYEKRIALVYDRLDLGGQQIMLLALASELQVRGWQVELLSFMPGELEERFRNKGIKVQVFPVRPKFRRILELRRHFKESRPLVVHTHLFSAGLWGRIAAKLAGVPVIIHTEGGMPFREKRWKRVPVERFLSHLGDRFVCVANAVKQHLIDAGGMTADSLVVIPNSYAATGLSMLPHRPIADPPILFSAGRLATIKGYDLLIRAIAQLDNFQGKLLLAGSGPEADNLTALAHSLGIEKNIEFLGYREDIPDLLARSDLYITPSRSEGMSVSILEAMVAGVPVVATDVGGNRELLANTGRIVPPEDPGALARAIADALCHSSETEALARNARRRAETTYSLEKMVNAYEDLFNSCLASKGILIPSPE